MVENVEEVVDPIPEESPSKDNNKHYLYPTLDELSGDLSNYEFPQCTKSAQHLNH